MEIIRPGHYRNKFTKDSEVQDIIRILGESDRPGMWLTSEKLTDLSNKLISEYELTNNYEFFGTSITESSITPNKKLLVGLDFLDDEVENDENITVQYVPKETNRIDEQISVITNPNNNQRILTVNPDELFIQNILEKISISKNNEKYDTSDAQEIITIEIKLPIDYNFTKLKETVNLLGLNKYLISNILLQDDSIKQSIFDELKAKILFLLNDDTKNIVKEEIPIVNKEIPIVNEEIPIVEEKISEINDERILKFQEKLSSLYK